MLALTLQEFLTTQIFAFMLCFVRMGSALMLFPGLGDTFIPQRVRLFIALSLSFVLFPVIEPNMPTPIPAMAGFISLIAMEFVVGIFMGTIARILMTALDTAGMVISMQTGLANAQMFNPALSSQGSIFGSFLSILGAVILFSLNMHHLLIASLVESYDMFPVGTIPDTGGMAQIVTYATTAAFAIGIKMAAPFFVLTLVLYVGMGILSRLMPQLQVFMVALPLQILLSFILVVFVLAAVMGYWSVQFEEGMVFFLKQF